MDKQSLFDPCLKETTNTKHSWSASDQDNGELLPPGPQGADDLAVASFMADYWAAASFQLLAEELELFETPAEATQAMLRAEILTPVVWDPCVGRGAIAEELKASGYRVRATDVYDWGYRCERLVDFLQTDEALADTIVFNPPFSLAVQFVQHALIRLKVRKVVVFQRFGWWESAKRVHGFWNLTPPNRMYGFDGRVTCWRGDIPMEKRLSSTPTAHAWFVWEANHPPGTLAGHLALDGRQDTPAGSQPWL